MSEPCFLAEGGYGCVYKPSLHCENGNKMDYNGKVSKILDNESAKVELSEYAIINSVDKDKKYFLGVPQKCKPDFETNYRALKKCGLVNFMTQATDLNQFSLLIMPDGGLDLEKYAKLITHRPNTKENNTKMELFWLEAHNIILGIKMFLEKGVTHFDLKGQNLLYDEKKNRINFIDFGIMKNISASINECKQSEFDRDFSFWSVPFESIYLNKNNFSVLKYGLH